MLYVIGTPNMACTSKTKYSTHMPDSESRVHQEMDEMSILLLRVHTTPYATHLPIL